VSTANTAGAAAAVATTKPTEPAAAVTTHSAAPIPTNMTTLEAGRGLLSVIPVTPAGFIHVTETVTKIVTERIVETVTATVTRDV
jgi:hypothetical protein